MLRFFTKKKQTGVCFVEATIIIPVFVLLLSGLLEVSRMLNAHILAAHLAYEGVRIASKTAGLNKEALDPGNPQTQYVITGNKVLEIQEKIEKLVNTEDTKILKAGDIQISPVSNNDELISVTVNLDYKPLFTFFAFKNKITSNSTSEYLYDF